MLEKLRRTICRIPKGRVSTYGDVARAAGYPGAARQVAWALHNSPGGVPWHRVLGAGGHIRLPGHAGLEQRIRLQAEGVAFRGARVDMARHTFDFASRANGRGSRAATKRNSADEKRRGEPRFARVPGKSTRS